MNLKELIYQRLKSTPKLAELCAKYDGQPAIFDTEAPTDTQEGWEGSVSTPDNLYL